MSLIIPNLRRLDPEHFTNLGPHIFSSHSRQSFNAPSSSLLSRISRKRYLLLRQVNLQCLTLHSISSTQQSSQGLVNPTISSMHLWTAFGPPVNMRKAHLVESVVNVFVVLAWMSISWRLEQWPHDPQWATLYPSRCASCALGKVLKSGLSLKIFFMAHTSGVL